MNRVEITRSIMGILHMQVCAVDDATDEEILKVCNEENPSGVENGWSEVIRESDDSLGREENKVPVPCEDHEGRTHFLVLC